MYPTNKWLYFGIFVKEQVNSLLKEGIDIDVLFIYGKKNKLNYLRGVWQIFRKSFTNKYDLVHAHYGLSGLIARCQFKYPVIVSFHGSDVNIPWERLLARFIAGCVDAVIVMSSRMKEKLGFDDAAIIPCGVDMKLFFPKPKKIARQILNLPQREFIAIFPGSPKNPAKKYDLFAQSLELLKNEGLEIKGMILQEISHNEIPLYLNSADVMVLTSDWEGSPQVIKEAMACNLPIVSVDVGDVKEVIGNTEGCYIAERTPEDIARKIELILKRNKRTNGRERIKHLSLENVAKKIVNIYREVINKKTCYDK